ncbi:MAG: hypothetical protein R3C20_17825 [Planctomycetaceae bacterium]
MRTTDPHIDTTKRAHRPTPPIPLMIPDPAKEVMLKSTYGSDVHRSGNQNCRPHSQSAAAMGQRKAVADKTIPAASGSTGLICSLQLPHRVFGIRIREVPVETVSQGTAARWRRRIVCRPLAYGGEFNPNRRHACHHQHRLAQR